VQDINRFKDATRYALELTIDPAARTVKGEQHVRYVNRDNKPLKELLLRLYPNTTYMGGEMAVTSIALNGMVVTPTAFLRGDAVDVSLLTLPLKLLLKPLESADVRMSYTLTFPLNSKSGYTTFGLIDGVLALPNAYAIIPPRDMRGWRTDLVPTYGDIVFSETSLFEVVIHAPKEYVVVATGMCTDHESDDRLKTTHCVAGPVRDFAIHLSRFYRTLTSVAPSDYGDNIVVRSYFTPLQRRGGENTALYATEALRIFERRFGPYPFKELKVFESPSVAGGIEYPMSVGVNHLKYQKDGGYFEWITAHEVAHQWWYGLIGSDPVNEAWLDEALAQYSASLYLEDRYGSEFARIERQRFFNERYTAELDERGDTRAGQPTDAFYRWSYSPIVYGKAPLFFEQVRREGGDARFNLWLRKYLESYRYGIARGEDLLRVADDIGLGRIARAAHARWILGR
jgi:hypothetical protein